MKKFEVTNRLIVEVRSDRNCIEEIPAKLREIADEIDNCTVSGIKQICGDSELLWEYEDKDSYFRIGKESLIEQYYYS